MSFHHTLSSSASFRRVLELELQFRRCLWWVCRTAPWCSARCYRSRIPHQKRGPTCAVLMWRL